MEFFERVFTWLAELSAKLPSVSLKTYFIVVLAIIAAVGVIVGLTFLGSSSFKLRAACLKILKYLENVDAIDDDNVGDFTAKCFSAKAPQSLRDAWVEYIGVRFGYPSDIVSEKAVFDKQVKKNGNVRANVFIGIALVLLAIFAFWGFGVLQNHEMSVIHCFGLLLSGALYLALVLIARAEYKKSLETFYRMQEDLDAKVNLQVEKNYATDSSPLTELAAMVEDIVARNTAKIVEISDEMNAVAEGNADATLLEDMGDAEFAEIEKITPIESLIAGEDVEDELEVVEETPVVSEENSHIEEALAVVEEEQLEEVSVKDEQTEAEKSEAEAESAEEQTVVEPVEEENQEAQVEESQEEGESEIVNEGIEEDSTENAVVEDSVSAIEESTQEADSEYNDEQAIFADSQETESVEEAVAEDAECELSDEVSEDNEDEISEELETQAEKDIADEEVFEADDELDSDKEQAAADDAITSIEDEITSDEDIQQDQVIDEDEDAQDGVHDESLDTEELNEYESQEEQEDKQETEIISEGDEEMFGKRKAQEAALAAQKAAEEEKNLQFVESEIINENEEFVESEIILDDVAENDVAQQAATEEPALEESVEEQPEEAVEEQLEEVAEDESTEDAVEEDAIDEDVAEEVVDEDAIDEDVDDEVVDEDAEEVAEEETADSEEPVEEEVVYVVEGPEEDDEVAKPAALIKLPHLVDYMVAQNMSKSMKIKVAYLLISAYNAYKDSPENKDIVIKCMFKLMKSFQA